MHTACPVSMQFQCYSAEARLKKICCSAYKCLNLLIELYIIVTKYLHV